MERDVENRSAARRDLALALVFGLGGAPALVAQVCWQRILALHSGVGTFSVTVIVGAYMAGLGIGSLVGGGLSRRARPGTALALFAAAEFCLAGFAWISGSFYQRLPGFDPTWFRGDDWRTALAHLAALLPPTILMGATLPLLVRGAVTGAGDSASKIARLYGCNVIGAAVGAAAAPWVLIPAFGLDGALRVGALFHLAGAAGVLFVRAGLPEGTEAERSGPAVVASTERRSPPFSVWCGLYLLSGFVAVALEIVWFRVVDVGVKGTTFTFGTVLAVYLSGLAAGSLAGSRVSRHVRDPYLGFLVCQIGLIVYASGFAIAMVRLDPGIWPLSWYRGYWGSYEPLAPGWSSLTNTVALYVLFPVALFGPPTVMMGLSFHFLQAGTDADPGLSGFKVGVLQAANIAGCAAGAFVVGLGWLDDFGAAGSLRILTGLGLIPAALLAVRTRSIPAGAGAAAAAGLLVALAPDGRALWGRLHGEPTGGALFVESAEGVAALTQEGGERWRMSTNGKGQSFLPFGGVHSKLGALPALIHPEPESILIIGLGSGDTAWAAACRGGTRRMTVAELCAAQRDLLAELAAKGAHPDLARFLADGRVNVARADGRAALAASDETYDIIEADAIRPNGSYSGNLYSTEFFRLCASRLRPGGMICTWSPTPRTAATFRAVFPHVLQFDGGVVLVGSLSPIPYDAEATLARLKSPEVTAYLGRSVVDECLGGLKTARVVQDAVRPSTDVNSDLDPKDEYR